MFILNEEEGVSEMKIGVYGGTFNPPHLGHLAAAQAAIDSLGLDKLLIIPAAIPPHKELPPGTPTAEHRLAMAETPCSTCARSIRTGSSGFFWGRTCS